MLTSVPYSHFFSDLPQTWGILRTRRSARAWPMEKLQSSVPHASPASPGLRLHGFGMAARSHPAAACKCFALGVRDMGYMGRGGLGPLDLDQHPPEGDMELSRHDATQDFLGRDRWGARFGVPCPLPGESQPNGTRLLQEVSTHPQNRP